MKFSAAVLALASACAVQVAAAASRVDHAPVPLQVNHQADAREWRAPVVDRTSPREATGWAMQQNPKLAGQMPRRESQGDNRAASAKTPTAKSKKSNKKKSKGEEVARASAPLKKPTKRSDDHNDRKKSKAVNTTRGKVPHDRKDKKSPTTGVRHGDSPAADEDLHATALSDTHMRQHFNAAQVEKEARTVGAAVVTHMAEAFRDETSKSLAFTGGIAGLGISVLGTVAAVVALFRQRSEFAEVELESDLPEDLESGRVADSSVLAAAAADGASGEVEDGECGSAESESGGDDAARRVALQAAREGGEAAAEEESEGSV